MTQYIITLIALIVAPIIIILFRKWVAILYLFVILFSCFPFIYWQYKTKNKVRLYKFCQDVVDAFIFIIGIEIEVEGLSAIDLNKKYVLISNHQSNLDGLLLMNIFKKYKYINIVGKRELEKIPLSSYLFGGLEWLMIDRNNLRQSLKVIIDGISFLTNENYPLLIFPEGTRSKSNDLGEFKAGAIKLATKSKTNILPITILNTYSAWEKRKLSFKKPKVIVRVSKPYTKLSNSDDKIVEDITTIISRKML